MIHMPAFPKFSKLLAALPAILLMAILDVFIVSAVSGVVLIELAASGHRYVGLGAALLTVVVTYSYIRFNHKLRDYIRAQETLDE